MQISVRVLISVSHYYALANMVLVWKEN